MNAPTSIAWRPFGRLLGFQPWTYLLVLLTKLCFITLLPQASGLLTRQFFDQLAESSGQAWGSQPVLWLLVGIGFARAVAIVVDMVGNRLFRHPLGALLRKNVLTYLLAQPAAQALTCSPSEAVSHLRDDVTIIANALYMTSFFVAHLLFALIAVGVMVQIDGGVTALVVAPLFGVVVTANRLRKRMEQLFRASRTTTDQITNFIGEIFGAVQAVQVATAEPFVLARFQQLNEQRRQAMVRTRLLNTLLEAVFRNIATLGMGLTLLVAAQAIQQRRFTVGDFVLFAFYLETLKETVHIIGMTLTELRQAQVSMGRLIQLLPALPATTAATTLVTHGPVYQIGPLPPVMQPAKTAADPLTRLDVQHLSYTYPGSERGIQDLSFTLWRGSLTVITGEVGAGKTTVLKLLLGLLPAMRGTILWNGERVLDPAIFFGPPRAAYTAQVPRLFSDSLLDNLLLGWPTTTATLNQAIQTARLEPDIAQLAQGLATQVGPRGVKLSGGQLQRAATARMLVRQAELLVVDDLSSALDGETERALWDGLLQQREHYTLLAVSHRPTILARADQVIHLQAGRHLA
ncbi:MAG: ABC transporter ATP-binding protein [Caldilineaceae bacterium]|nr:ABC transporter ATP-binding protein [Caldilineaceae bacterium]